MATEAAPVVVSIDEQFGGCPFVLTDGAIQRIHDILTERRGASPAYNVEYHDGTRFRNVGLAEVLKADNHGNSGLKDLEVRSEFDWQNTVKVTFAAREYRPIQCQISMTDRDKAYLISRDLCDFIRGDVVRSPLMAQLVSTAVLFFVGAWLVWMTVRAMPTTHPLPDLAHVLDSADANVKLNYLLQRGNTDIPWYLGLSLVLSVVVPAFVCMSIWIAPITGLLKYVYPMNVFAIGRDGIRHRRALDWRTRFFWAVIIGSLVRLAWSVITSFSHQ